MCGCANKPAAGVTYTRIPDGRLVSDERLTLAAMAQAGVKGSAYRNGVVRWIGVDWYGVPYPIRLLLIHKGKLSSAKKLPGCGCIVWLKDAWERLRLVLGSSRKHKNVSGHIT